MWHARPHLYGSTISINFKTLLNGTARLSASLVFGTAGVEAVALIKSLQESQTDLDKQIQETVGLLSRSSQLISTLETTLKEREVKLRTLQQEYKRLEGLTTLTAEQSKAVTDSLSQLMGRSAKEERWVAFGINIVVGLIIFICGIFLSDIIKGLPNRFLSRRPAASSPAKPAPAATPAADQPVKPQSAP